MKRVSSSGGRGTSGKGIRGTRSVSGRGHNGPRNYPRINWYRGRRWFRKGFRDKFKFGGDNLNDYSGNSWIYQVIGTLVAIGFLALLVFLAVR